MLVATFAYLGLTTLGALIFISDCTGALTSVAPGDSAMALEFFHCVGYLVLLLTLLTISWRLRRSYLELRVADAVVLAVTLTLCILLVRAHRCVAPSIAGSNPIWLFLCCACPGAFGGIQGRRVAVLFRGQAVSLKFAGICAGTCIGAALYVWPIEISFASGALMNVRGLPVGWSRESLFWHLALCCCVGIASGMGMLLWHVHGGTEAVAAGNPAGVQGQE
jgi:hypothetical protein